MMSTVFMKQHVVVDIIAAIVVVEIGILVAKIIYRRKNKNAALETEKK